MELKGFTTSTEVCKRDPGAVLEYIVDNVGRSTPFSRLAIQLDVKVLPIDAPEDSLDCILVDEDESTDYPSVQLLHPVDQRGWQLLEVLVARQILGTVVHTPNTILFH